MRDVVLLALVIAWVPISLARPWIGILGWTCIGLAAFQHLSWYIGHIVPFAVLVGGATLVGLVFTKDKRPVPWSAEMIFMVLLTLHMGLTTAFAWEPEDAWFRYKDFLKVILMAVVGTMLIHGRNRVRWLLLVAALSIGMYGIKGGAWAVLTGGVHRVFGPAGSFLFDNNFFGLACVMVIPVMMMLAREEPNKWMRRLLYGAVVLNILAAVFTYSRGAVVGLAIVLPLLFLRSQQRILLLVFIVPLAFIGKDLLPEKWVTRQESTLNYEQDESAMQRLATWNVHLNVALDRPLVGAGFNFHDSPDVQRYRSYASPETIRYLSHAHGTAAHSVYFQLLGQHGFVGLGLFLGMLGAMYFRLRRIIRLCIGRKDVQWIASYASGLRIALIGYVVCGIFLSVAYFELLYLMVTVPAILAREMAAAGVGQVSTMVHRGTPLYPAAPAPKV